MKFCSPEPESSNIMTYNKITRVNSFNPLECSVSYEGKKIQKIKLPNFLKITGLINTIFKPLQVKKHIRLKIYNTVALLTLLYGSKNWAVKANDKTRTAAS
jgi:hypothetical protein